MFRKFARDRRGNYALIAALAMLPVMGAVALAVDYSEVSRQRQVAQNALDAASLAVSIRYLGGSTKGEMHALAQDYFEASFEPTDTANPKVTVTFPNGNTGGGTVKACANLQYPPFFYPAVQMLTGDTGDPTIEYTVCSEVQLKNTVEVALVLDNSATMRYKGYGSGRKRIDLLKDASKELVNTLADRASHVEQVDKPLQFGIVPFAASVNVGPQHRDADWIDKEGRSPIHHENFAWKTMKQKPGDWRVQKRGNVFRKTGDSWGKEKGDIVTRFTLYDSLTYRPCLWLSGWRDCGKWSTREKSASKWGGCVEVRPWPHNVKDTVPKRGNPKTLFVPMFAPDETNQRRNGKGAHNDWWHDRTGGNALYRQEFMPKYFRTYNKLSYMGLDDGPNEGCTTKPITPLTDVTTHYGLRTIEDAIDGMAPLGNTNVPEGIGWGWRVLSHNEPFTEGRKDEQRGNDKVVIVLTDGQNTYYKPANYAGLDDAKNESTYAAYGYAKSHRIFDGTDYSGYWTGYYTRAMKEHMLQNCENAKDENIMVMTVALDLDQRDQAEGEQIDALKECASVSRFRTDANGNPVKLFWNTTGAELSEKFREIADELSNLRLVS